MGNGEIWVCPNGLKAGRHIKTMFEEGKLLNPVRLIDHTFDFHSHFSSDAACPLLLLLDLSCENAWDILASLREIPATRDLPVIALIDDTNESLLDRAYEAGAKTYLRTPLAFSEFVLRARLVGLNFLITSEERHRAEPMTTQRAGLGGTVS